MKRSIRFKLSIPVVSFLFFILFSMGSDFYLLMVQKRTNARLRLADRLETAIRDLENNFNIYEATMDPDTGSRIQNLEKDLGSYMDLLRNGGSLDLGGNGVVEIPAPTGPVLRRRIARIAKIWIPLQKDLRSLSEADYNRARIQSEISSFRSETDRFVNYLQLSAGERIYLYKILQLAIVGVGVVIVLIVFFLSVRSIVRPLRELNTFMAGLSHGQADLTYRVPVHTTDEIGEAGGSFNNFMERLRVSLIDLFTGFRESILGDSAFARNLNRMAAEAQMSDWNLKEGTTELESITTSLQQQSASIEEMSASMQVVSDAIRELGNIAAGMSSRANEGKQSMTEISGTVVRLSGEMGGVANSAKALEERASTIGEVVNTISSISDQVNMLALNAAIEAARAGESGSGFAVVANEVGKLADQSKRAVAGIVENLKHVIDGVEKNAGDMFAISESLSELSDRNGAVTTRINGILEGINQMSEGIGRIMESTRDVETTIHEVSTTSQSVSDYGIRVFQKLEEEQKRIQTMDHDIHDMVDRINDSLNVSLKLVQKLALFNLSDKELFQHEINDAIKAHDVWMEKLDGILKGGERDLETNHRRCRFGIYYNSIVHPSGCEDMWDEVDRLHKEVHSMAERIYHELDGDQTDRARESFKRAKDASTKLKGLLQVCVDKGSLSVRR